MFGPSTISLAQYYDYKRRHNFSSSPLPSSFPSFFPPSLSYLIFPPQKNPPPEMMEIIFNHKSVDVNVRDPFGWAPIHSMCKSSSIDLICLLADAGADLAATNLKVLYSFILSFRLLFSFFLLFFIIFF